MSVQSNKRVNVSWYSVQEVYYRNIETILKRKYNFLNDFAIFSQAPIGTDPFATNITSKWIHQGQVYQIEVDAKVIGTYAEDYADEFIRILQKQHPELLL